MFILPKIGAKSFGIGIQDICKVSVRNFWNHSLAAEAENYPETGVVAYAQTVTLNKLSACHRLVMLVCFVFCFALLCSTQR